MSSQQSWDSGGGLCWQSHNTSLSEWSSEDRDDEQLALFQDLVSREQRSFLHNPSWEDIDASLNSLAEFGGVVSPLAPHRGVADLLTSDTENNDYEWLIAPPEAPLFLLLDDKESLKSPSSQGRALSALKTSRVSRSQEPPRRSLGRNCSPGRPSTASSTSSAYSPSRRTLSASPRPALRSSKPSARAYPSSRGPSPVAARRSLTPTLQGRAGSPSANRPGNAALSRNGRNPPSPKLQPFHPEFFTDARLNLRTPVSDFSTPSTDPRRRSVASCFDGTEMNGGKEQPVSLNFSRSSFSSFSHDHFSSQTSKDSISSSCDDDTDIAQSLGLDNDDLISLDFIDEDLVSSSERNLPTAGKYTHPTSKQQSKANGTSATSKRSASVPYSKKYSGPISRQVDSARNSQRMFRPLLSSVPASSFYSMRPIAAHNRQPLQLTYVTAENTEHRIAPLPEPEPEQIDENRKAEPELEQIDENRKAEMMDCLPCENSAEQLALEELEEEKLRLANPRRLDFGISSCTEGVNPGESVDSCEIKEFDIASSASTGWKPERSLDDDGAASKTCVTKPDTKKQDFANNGYMDIDTDQVAAAVHHAEENRGGLLIDILKEDNTCGGTPPEHIQGINNTPKEKGSFSEPLEPETPIQSWPSGHVQKESASLEPQRSAYLNQGPRSHNLSYNELHLSSPYQDIMKYRSFCHWVSKSNSSKSNSLNSSKGHDLHLSQEIVDLPNRSRAVLKPASATGSSNLQRSRDSVDKELASLIPAKQHAERKSNSLNGDLMLAMAIRRSNSINMEVNSRSLDGVNSINRIIASKENARNPLKKQQNMAQDEARRKGAEVPMSILLKRRESLPANKSELFSEEGYYGFTDDQEATVVTTDSHDLEMPELGMKSSMPVLSTDTDTDAELQGSFLHLSKFPMCESSEQIDTGMVETDPIDENHFTGAPVDNQVLNNKHVAMDEDFTDTAVLQTSSCASDFDTGEIRSLSSQLVDGIAEHAKDLSMDLDGHLLDSSSAKGVGFSVITSDHSSETPVQNGSGDEPDRDNLPVRGIEQNAIPAGDNRKFPSRPYSMSLEEATTTVLFCSSIVHDAMYRAISIAMEKEATATATTSASATATATATSTATATATDTATAAAAPIPTAELMITSQSIFAANKIFRPGKRKGQSLADSTTRATKTLTYKQNQKASFSSITVQQNPVDKTGNTIIGNQEKPATDHLNQEELANVVIPTPAKSTQKQKIMENNKGGGCKCSCTIM